jgi:hypothetical protein
MELGCNKGQIAAARKLLLINPSLNARYTIENMTGTSDADLQNHQLVVEPAKMLNMSPSAYIEMLRACLRTQEHNLTNGGARSKKARSNARSKKARSNAMSKAMKQK